MSIDAMKLALRVLSACLEHPDADDAIAFLRTAIEEAEKQEPVAWVTGLHAGRCVIQTVNPAAILPVGIALYTTPPAAQRQWVGLTHEDLSVCDEDGVILARYWEAKLKEKNT